MVHKTKDDGLSLMFYNPADNHHGLAADPFKAIVAPRPIGWIGSRNSQTGVLNLAPYSFFNAISDQPKQIIFSSEGRKDSVCNIEMSGEFTVNLVSFPLVERMNITAIPASADTDEFTLAGLTPVTGRVVAAPYVGEAHAVLECRMTEMFQPRTLAGTKADNIVVIAQVVGIHIDPAIVTDGRIDITKARTVGRLGYSDYAEITEVFRLKRPEIKR